MRAAEADDPCWSRLYPDFDALNADGRFELLADEVWGRIQAWAANHVTVVMHEPVMEGALSDDAPAAPGSVGGAA